MRKNRRDNKAKYLLILLLLIAVGYAAIATTLKINGSSNIKSARWDVYWENPQVLSGSVTETKPTLSESDTKATFDVTLNEPGDYYEFTIDAVNNGSLDAKIDTNGIVKQIKNSSDEVVNPKILKYEVTNNDQEHTAIEEGHILAKKSGNTPTKETYRVRVEYRNDSEIDPSDLDDSQDLVFTIEFSIKYVQGPKAEPAKTWDKFYYYANGETQNTTTFDNSWKVWGQENTSTGDLEICGNVGSSPICIPYISEDDFFNQIDDSDGFNPIHGSTVEYIYNELINKGLNITAFDSDGLYASSNDGDYDVNVINHNSNTYIRYDEDGNYFECGFDYYSDPNSIYCR